MSACVVILKKVSNLCYWTSIISYPLCTRVMTTITEGEPWIHAHHVWTCGTKEQKTGNATSTRRRRRRYAPFSGSIPFEIWLLGQQSHIYWYLRVHHSVSQLFNMLQPVPDKIIKDEYICASTIQPTVRVCSLTRKYPHSQISDDSLCQLVPSPLSTDILPQIVAKWVLTH